MVLPTGVIADPLDNMVNVDTGVFDSLPNSLDRFSMDEIVDEFSRFIAVYLSNDCLQIGKSVSLPRALEFRIPIGSSRLGLFLPG